MGKLLAKIVLTGGPCAGKTTALARVEEDLIEKGYQVFIVSESATELIKGGIKPFGVSPIEMLKFQELILRYQLDKEKIYEEAIKSLPEDKECIIIYDRGILDNKAYVSNAEFKFLLQNLQLKELSLMDNYDMVLHLVSAADGKVEYYTLSNNEARSETVEEAKNLDRKTAAAWAGHNNLKIIDNSTEFDEKINRVIEYIHNHLGNPVSLKKQRKYKIDLTNADLIIGRENCVAVDMEQIYLASNDKYERRLRKKVYEDYVTYYYSVQNPSHDGLREVIIDKKITEKEFQRILALNTIASEVKKRRYTFISNKQYFKLDVFENTDYAILEVEPVDGKKILLPEYIKGYEDVSNDSSYINSEIAKRVSLDNQLLLK